MIALAHPGKLGDFLYSWPTARFLAHRHQCKVDFYTSDYCLPAKRFLRYQTWCNDVIVPADYKITDFGCGGQPWRMPVPEGKYEAVYQCGFSSTPTTAIHDWIRLQHGITQQLDIAYDVPELKSFSFLRADGVIKIDDLDALRPYVVMAPRGETSYKPVFQEFARLCPYLVIEVGGHGDAVAREHAYDLGGLDFLETAAVISKAKAFVGIMSSMWVVASGFPIPNYGLHDGIHWDTRHFPLRPWNHYPINPTAQSLVEAIKAL